MTATIVAKQPDRIVLATDTAWYRTDGVVCGFAPKVVTLPHLPAAIAWRGAQCAGALFGNSLGLTFSSFDDMALGFADAFENLHDRFLPLLEQEGSADLQLVVVGWSAAKAKPEAFVVQSIDEVAHGETDGQVRSGVMTFKAFQPQPISGDFYYAPCPPDDVLTAAGLDGDTGLDASEYCRRMLESCRRVAVDMGPDVGDRFIVGGSGMMTTVTADGVDQRTICRWPADAIGELIAPEPMPRSVVALPATGMNRQQRRALEKQRRRS